MSTPLIDRGDSADSERLAALRDAPGGWDYTGWLAVVDYLSWYTKRDKPLGGTGGVTWGDAYMAKYGFTLEDMHARREGRAG